MWRADCEGFHLLLLYTRPSSPRGTMIKLPHGVPRVTQVGTVYRGVHQPFHKSASDLVATINLSWPHLEEHTGELTLFVG